MLHPAVLLDAAMSASDARRRLAEHGYWHPDGDQEVRAWLAERVATLAEDLRVELASSPLDAVPVLPTADELARHLRRPTEGARVAVRREEGVTVFWYARDLGRVLGQLAGAPDDARLRDVLGLREFTSDPAVQAAEVSADALDAVTGVVLRGSTLVGVGDGGAPTKPLAGSATRGGFGNDRGLPRDILDGAEKSTPAPAAPAPPATVQAYPSLDAPQVVAARQPFDLTIGLADAPVAGVASSGRLTLTAAPGATTITVDVQVAADGFDAPDGWRHQLEVPVATPTTARVTVRLVPQAQSATVRQATLNVRFTTGGTACGYASRHVVVLADPAALPPVPDDRGAFWLDLQPAAAAMRVAAPAAPPDVEVDLSRGDGSDARGRYLCTMRNAHGVPAPDAPLPVDLGTEAGAFAKALIDDVRVNSGEGSLVDNVLRARGRRVASKLPAAFWAMLRAIAAKVAAEAPERALTLQFNSAEPYVPWELALVDPPLDPARPPFLAAQVAMGRWTLGDALVAAPPRAAMTVRTMAVMAGMYGPTSGMTALPEAAAECRALVRAYAGLPAVPVECSPAAIQRLFDVTLEHQFEPVSGVQAVHIAAHGEVDPTRPGDAALYMNNGRPLYPSVFGESELGRAHAPFLFLNACMVGVGGEVLGDAGGFPGNCLSGGFSGLVAPLWAVNDEVARTVAVDFYREALPDSAAGASRPVAEVLRDLRARYDRRNPVPTLLAYVYYGNPRLTLTRAASTAPVAAA